MEEPKNKLTTQHIEKLIDLYKSEPRLWHQTHPEYYHTELVRKSWQRITENWNEYCNKNFSTTDVRIRVSTLCQRYLKERERLENDGELDESVKFIYFDKLKFLDEEQTLKNRRLLFEKQNQKLIEIYKQYPLLWISAQKHLKQTDQRDEAWRSISTALRHHNDIHLTPYAVKRRIQALRKCYRIEKIRYLHCLMEQKVFETKFKHWQQLQYIDKHIDPYVCEICGKIFQFLNKFREHIKLENHQQSISLERENNEAEQMQMQMQMTDMQQEAKKATSENNEIVMKRDEKYTLDKIYETTTLNNEVTNEAATFEGLEKIKRKSCENTIIIETTQTVANNAHIIENRSESNDSCLVTTTTNFDCHSASQPQTTSSFHDDDSSVTDQPVNSNFKTAKLNVEQTHKLIEIYKFLPQLWDPNHLDYHKRNLRRQSWHELAKQFNQIFETHFQWLSFYRKINEYVKYYKREKQRTELRKNYISKWIFYMDFSFLDDVLPMTNELQKTLQQKENNFKIIEVYKSFPQLWDTKHPEFTKRSQRPKAIDNMCSRLQEEHNIQITSERLKQRLIELRCNYRAVKEQRMAALKRNEDFVTDYKYYELLHFLEPHVAPFNCNYCTMSFKLLTDLVRHERKRHVKQKMLSQLGYMVVAGIDDSVENICHICGMKFTMRNNLMYHLKRHLGQRTHACSMCPKAFYNKTSLMVHERTHTKERPYVCELCGNAYVSSSKLNQHVKRHSDKRDYPCDRCDKKFYTAFERDRHVRHHMNIREKVCPVCGKTFGVGSTYYAHMMLHSGVKRYKCEECEQRFAQYAGLYKHRKRHHPKIKA